MSLPQTMKAIVTVGQGGYDTLQYRDVSVPQPQAGEVLLRVLAAGMNNTEINTRLGWYSSDVSGSTDSTATNASDKEHDDGGWSGKTPFPLIQGTDCCGEVVALGGALLLNCWGSGCWCGLACGCMVLMILRMDGVKLRRCLCAVR